MIIEFLNWLVTNFWTQLENFLKVIYVTYHLYLVIRVTCHV